MFNQVEFETFIDEVEQRIDRADTNEFASKYEEDMTRLLEFMTSLSLAITAGVAKIQAGLEKENWEACPDKYDYAKGT